MARMIRLTVSLNGTDENPWHRYGLTQNPIPQLGKKEYDAACLRLQALDGEPIKDTYDLCRRLSGFSQEFVDLCCEAYTPGERIAFCTTFEETLDAALHSD